jgi:hypothetical protein
MLDLSVAYHRYRFLGDEFLTWLWFTIENDPEIFQSVDPDCTEVDIGNRIVLENRKTKSIERISIKGDDAGLEEGRVALRKGALVAEMALVFKTAEHRWDFLFKGENFSIANLRVPGPNSPQGSEETEAFVSQRYDYIEKILKFIENTYKIFIRERLSPRWEGKRVPAIRKWIKAGES